MKLRKLELKDAPFMLEWMHDVSVVKDLKTDFLSKTMEDCEKFIKTSWEDKVNIYLAITDEKDIYMGTVGLKNINFDSAEFAITIRALAMGKGYSIDAMKEIIHFGFHELGLKKIYWCVSPNNKRAVRFYDKNGFQRINVSLLDSIQGYNVEQKKAYIWYQEQA